MPAAVLGHVGDPHRDGLRRRVDRHRPPAQPDLARVGRRQAEEDPRQLGPARADQPGQAQDLAGADAQVDVPHARRRGSPARGPPAPRRPARPATLGKTADSSRPTIIRISSPRETSAIRRVPTRTPSRRAVTRSAILRQLLQPVRDVDDPHAVRLQLADDPEQPLDLLVAERGRRLVHDQDPRVGPERPRDLDELLLGHRQPADLGLRVDRRADPVQQPPRPLAPLVPADPPPRPARLQPDRDVLGRPSGRGRAPAAGRSPRSPGPAP